MELILKQSDKAHDANHLHDELIAAGIAPTLVESSAEATRIVFADTVKQIDVLKVLDAHTKKPRPPAPDLAALIGEYEAETP